MGNFCGSNHWRGQRLDVTQLFIAANTAARVALGNNVPGPTQANVGDMCTQTDTSQWYIMSAKSTPSVDGDWTAITPANAALIANTPAGGIAAVNVQAAINELDTEKGNVAGIVTVGPLALAGAGALAANTTAMEAIAVAGMPADAVIIGLQLSAAPIAGAVFAQPRNDGAGNAEVTYGNITAAPIAVAADAAMYITYISPAAW